ncbi:heme exporter protein CcmD [Stenotrophomonas ginsengisoli]|uniref:heme exporter protein CcmD n=1 Tax=Stenotrophomonas ginsengisoli TaxID=336566 RepID=UPI0009F853BE|nr:heme exporter protein CcmD [Stenotrophomonas ginsengisoli]
MSYLGYVIAAYAVFALVLLADWLAGLLAVRRALRQARQRPPARRSARPTLPTELER